MLHLVYHFDLLNFVQCQTEQKTIQVLEHKKL